ncbi:hypothetical protein CRG98_008360 [Punica granatum]|uniref:Uncharacterized protein n=1 Tax=Punica granatum TaxID=22663 RepID=A0A2I0KSF9_PUNGR|nr:hypothetical protein CRG98_008360 [Punica granatum]
MFPVPVPANRIPESEPEPVPKTLEQLDASSFCDQSPYPSVVAPITLSYSTLSSPTLLNCNSETYDALRSLCAPDDRGRRPPDKGPISWCVEGSTVTPTRPTLRPPPLLTLQVPTAKVKVECSNTCHVGLNTHPQELAMSRVILMLGI